MNDDYISREAATKVLCDACGNAACPKGMIPRCSYYERMKSIHDADVVEVVHGEWIIRNNPSTGWYRVTCSECGEDVTATAPCIGFFPNAKISWDYCPNCGAKMGGDGDAI